MVIDPSTGAAHHAPVPVGGGVAGTGGFHPVAGGPGDLGPMVIDPVTGAAHHAPLPVVPAVPAVEPTADA